MKPNFPGKPTFIGSQLSQKANFPGKATFLGSELSQELSQKVNLEVNFPWKSTFLGNLLSHKVNFPGKYTVPGSQLYHTSVSNVIHFGKCHLAGNQGMSYILSNLPKVATWRSKGCRIGPLIAEKSTTLLFTGTFGHTVDRR